MTEHLWKWFQQLHAQRQTDMGIPQAIPHGEIVAWAAAMRQELRPWEVACIVQIDVEWRAARSQIKKPRRGRTDGR